MDSMRSLNTSLPGSSTPRQPNIEPPEELLSAFKAAALSVTKLYKTAATDQARTRSEGYQDALDELLGYLDKEDIGLSDGEGWRIRRWATERLDGRDTMSLSGDDEPTEKADRPSSPVGQRTQSAAPAQTLNSIDRAVSPVRTESSAASPTPASAISTFSLNPPQGTFTFRSSHPYPNDAEMTLSGLNITENPRVQGPDVSASTIPGSATPSPTITFSRSPRNNLRHNHAARLAARSSNTMGRGAGQKRKINFNDFFDVGNLGHGRDKDASGGGGKRGKYA